MPIHLLFPEELRKKLTRRYHNQHRKWLLGQAEWPMSINLGSPNEQQALLQLDTVHAWVTAWQFCQGPGEIIWRERRWGRLGVHNFPEKILLRNPHEVAIWVDEITRWENASQRYQHFISRWPLLNRCLSNYFDVLAEYSDDDMHRVEKMLAWLEDNPQSNLYPRQIPLVGIDTKWLEQRKSLISDLVAALQKDENTTTSFFRRCGLKQIPYTIRLRILDKNLRQHFNGLADMSIPLSDLNNLNFHPKQVYIIENLQTGLAFDDLPDSVIIMPLGYSVDVLAHTSWLFHTNCIYWGDIDTHGLAILNRARSHLPHLQSILMDEETLHLHQPLWGHEEKQNPATNLPYLTLTEQTVYQGLKQQQWGNNVRLEQERISWDYAWIRINEISTAKALCEHNN
jgi:hypothetical protein